MRAYRPLLFPTCLLGAVCSLLQAVGQQTPANDVPLPCTGNIEVMRLSDIKPGMMLKFFQAVALQQAWYKKAGTTDQIEIKRVVEFDSATKSYVISPTQAVTSHIEPVVRGRDLPHDADYDQFVALYKDSASIKTEFRTCISH